MLWLFVALSWLEIVLAVLSVLVELVVPTDLAMLQAVAVLVVLLVHVAVHAVHIVLVLSVPTRIHPPTLCLGQSSSVCSKQFTDLHLTKRLD